MTDNANSKISKPKRTWWQWLKKPLLLGIPTGLFVLVFLLAGAHGTIELSSTNTFCFSCHLKMDTIVQEYKASPHYISKKTDIGGQHGDADHPNATCADCHVPNNYIEKLGVKVKATADIYYMMIGKITKENFEANRMRLARVVKADMKASDSQNCRDCHVGDKFDLSKQPLRAKLNHQDMVKNKQTCVDCHSGVAHKRVFYME